MYTYEYDTDTGGILLKDKPVEFSKEPRPVYAPELDLLGFDKYWNYDKQTDSPYMWAEANRYYYRGRLVAKLKGGNIYTAPEIILSTDEDGNIDAPEQNGSKLRPVNIKSMVEKNKKIIGRIEDVTVKRIKAIYDKYCDKLDCFHVAFSGGKDSVVLLELVRNTLPKGSYEVIFGDTGMEFPDTYMLISEIKTMCDDEKIPFHVAKSRLNPEESWKLFGPPSRVFRWCCSVHKTAPQVLKIREIIGKVDYKGLAFVGVRKHESLKRSEYEYENYNKKQKGQHFHNSILEWTSAEIWLYIYSQNLIINKAYKNGFNRVGCIYCPGSSEKDSFLKNILYPKELNKYIDIIVKSNKNPDSDFDYLIINNGWCLRPNGRDLVDNPVRYVDNADDKYLTIEINNPSSDWEQWIKTIEIDICMYSVTEMDGKYIAKIDVNYIKKNPTISKLFRQVFHKATSCINCEVCIANCLYKSIIFNENNLNIKDCIKCLKCHDIYSGCTRYESIRHPQGGNKVMNLDTFQTHVPEYGWFQSFFEKKDDYFTSHGLSDPKISKFRSFLISAGLKIDKKDKVTPFAELISRIGWDSDIAQGLIFVNLVNNNLQFKWYVKNLDIGEVYTKNALKNKLSLILTGKKDKAINHIIGDYKRLTVRTPLGTSLNFGHVTENDDFIRTKCSVPNRLVILYGLFKYAEKNGNKNISLSNLLDDDFESEAISPTRIFGIDGEEMEPILKGLSAKYPEFISATFALGLDKITLMEDKTSEDVLGLF